MKNANKGPKVHLKVELHMTNFLSLLRDGHHNSHLQLITAYGLIVALVLGTRKR